MPSQLSFLPEIIKGRALFKSDFAHNSFLICQDEFKSIVDSCGLGGVIFETDLANMFSE